MEPAFFEVVFVCTGNSCRSPMAEGLLRRLLAERAAQGEARAQSIRVSSAGTHAPEGVPATPEAVAACAAVGAEIGRHRSRPLDRAIIERAGLLLAMEPHHLVRILACQPSAARKVALLTDYAGEIGSGASESELGVPDPFGRDLDTYRGTCARLDHLIEAALPRILRFGAGEGAGAPGD